MPETRQNEEKSFFEMLKYFYEKKEIKVRRKKNDKPFSFNICENNEVVVLKELFPFNTEDSIRDKLKEVEPNDIALTFPNQILGQEIDFDFEKVKLEIIKDKTPIKQLTIFFNNSCDRREIKTYNETIIEIFEKIFPEVINDEVYKNTKESKELKAVYVLTLDHLINLKNERKVKHTLVHQENITDDLRKELDEIKSEKKKLLGENAALERKYQERVNKNSELLNIITTLQQKVELLESEKKALESVRITEQHSTKSVDKLKSLDAEYKEFVPTISKIKQHYLRDFIINNPVDDFYSKLDKFNVNDYIQDEVLKNFTKVEYREYKTFINNDKLISGMNKLGIEVIIPNIETKLDLKKHKIIDKEDSSYSSGSIIRTKLVGLKKKQSAEVFYKAEVIISR